MTLFIAEFVILCSSLCLRFTTNNITIFQLPLTFKETTIVAVNIQGKDKRIEMLYLELFCPSFGHYCICIVVNDFINAISETGM